MMKSSLLAVFLFAIAGAGVHAAQSNSVKPSSHCDPAASESEAVRRAFFLTFPLYEIWRTRQRMLSLSGAQVNSLIHRRTLSKPTDRSITTPNTDTLYSTAWLDLAEGPVRLAIPAMGSRYHSVELMHVFSDAFAILRNERKDAQHFLIVGPNWTGTPKPNETIIRSPTRDAWLVVRNFVAGADDLAEAQRLQSAYKVLGTSRGVRKTDATIPARPNGSQFLAVVNMVLERGPLPAMQTKELRCIGSKLTSSNALGPAPQIDPAMRVAFDRRLEDFYKETRLAFENSGDLRNEWRFPQINIADFGADHVYRSAMALGGLAALPISEAVNPLTTKDANSEPLAGTSRYQIRIPSNIPVDAFWSLTLYESDDAGRWFLYENSLGRYSVNSLAHTIETAADGTIVVDIAHRQSAAPSNWLPAPRGRFMLVFRAYRPRATFIDGSFEMPAVIRSEDQTLPASAFAKPMAEN